MKFNTLFATIAFAASSLAVSSAANATVINFSGSNVNMAAVQHGQSGTISNLYATLFTIPPNVVGGGTIFGNLPSNAAIVFNYTFTGLIDGILQGNTQYNYNVGPNNFQGFATAATNAASNSGGTINAAPSASLVFSSANINIQNPGVSTGTVTMANTSSSFASFASIFSGILSLNPSGTGSATYAVSAIPLPAALPMFATMLAGMFGFARSRKNKAVAA